MDIDGRLTDVFRTVLNDHQVQLTDATTASDVEGWDSVAHINLIFAVEEEFGIRLSTADLSALNSVGDLARAIHGQLNAA